MKGYIHSFESLGTLDGPGIRFVIFLAGCNLRCIYCHNPDTWMVGDGTDVSVSELMEKIMSYQPYFGTKGGITVSGGEPLLQANFVKELFIQCKLTGISTCLDTNSSLLNEDIKDLLRVSDYILADVKHTKAEKYQEITGRDIRGQDEFMCFCSEERIHLRIRQVLIEGYTDDETYADSLLNYIKPLNVRKLELLPYHDTGKEKWRLLKSEYIPANMPAFPTDKLKQLKRYYKCNSHYEVI